MTPPAGPGGAGEDSAGEGGARECPERPGAEATAVWPCLDPTAGEGLPAGPVPGRPHPQPHPHREAGENREEQGREV